MLVDFLVDPHRLYLIHCGSHLLGWLALLTGMFLSTACFGFGFESEAFRSRGLLVHEFFWDTKTELLLWKVYSSRQLRSEFLSLKPNNEALSIGEN